MAAKPEQWDLKGQVALVTGRTGGIGYQTARALLPAAAVNVWAAQRRACRTG
jgi:NAD(P)-dependent dehydrogenase (short-subunit alcohol dehydrogenase family)